jgi:hypothetical protein
MKNNTKPAPDWRAPAQPESDGLDAGEPGERTAFQRTHSVAPMPLRETTPCLPSPPPGAEATGPDDPPERRPDPDPAPVCLKISHRTVLVTADVVRAVYGVDTEAVMAKVESGELQWVFDVSVRGGNCREPRFWARELMAPERCRMTPAQAVQAILGEDRERWRGTAIQQLLMVSRPSVLRWHRAGDLPGKRVGHTFFVARRTLDQFLTARLWWKDPISGFLGIRPAPEPGSFTANQAN